MAEIQVPAPAAGQSLDRVGLTASIGAYLIWGFFPAYFILLEPSGPFEIVAHRAFWALPTMLIALALGRQLIASLRQLMRPRTLAMLAVTATIIAGNWLIYIYAVQNGHVLDASLGYFINPLVSVALGVVLLKERMSVWGWIALGLASIGVLNEIVVVGQPPVVALVLAGSFAAYGYMRKIAKVDAGAGLLGETAFLAPVALGVVIWFEMGLFGGGGGGHFLSDPRIATLLVLTGPLTAAPLFLFAVGARRLPLIAVGVLQFIAPTIQFLMGLAYGEPFTLAHAVTFGFVWAGLLVFTRDLIKTQAGAKGRP